MSASDDVVELSLRYSDFADTKRWQVASAGDSTFLSGGLLSYFDGTRVAEVGFLVRPRVSGALGGVGTTSASTTEGT